MPLAVHLQCLEQRDQRHRPDDVHHEQAQTAADPDLAELAGLDAETFRERFRNSPVKRAKRRGLLRNVAVALGNAGDAARRHAGIGDRRTGSGDR